MSFEDICHENFDETLENCIEAMERGESLATCLSLYPSYAPELEPLLSLIGSIQAVPVPSLSLSAFESGRAAVAEAVQQKIGEQSLHGEHRSYPYQNGPQNGTAPHTAVNSTLPRVQPPERRFLFNLPAGLRPFASGAVAASLILIVGMFAFMLRGRLPDLPNSTAPDSDGSGTSSSIQAPNSVNNSNVPAAGHSTVPLPTADLPSNSGADLVSTATPLATEPPAPTATEEPPAPTSTPLQIAPPVDGGDANKDNANKDKSLDQTSDEQTDPVKPSLYNESENSSEVPAVVDATDVDSSESVPVRPETPTTATAVIPTATNVIATASPTSVPPTALPATEIPTEVPPTAVPTEVPPTVAPPTAAQPNTSSMQESSDSENSGSQNSNANEPAPTSVPSTPVPPTPVPTEVPPTEVPPTAVPPTAAPAVTALADNEPAHTTPDQERGTARSGATALQSTDTVTKTTEVDSSAPAPQETEAVPSDAPAPSEPPAETEPAPESGADAGDEPSEDDSNSDTEETPIVQPTAETLPEQPASTAEPAPTDASAASEPPAEKAPSGEDGSGETDPVEEPTAAPPVDPVDESSSDEPVDQPIDDGAEQGDESDAADESSTSDSRRIEAPVEEPANPAPAEEPPAVEEPSIEEPTEEEQAEAPLDKSASENPIDDHPVISGSESDAENNDAVETNSKDKKDPGTATLPPALDDSSSSK